MVKKDLSDCSLIGRTWQAVNESLEGLIGWSEDSEVIITGDGSCKICGLDEGEERGESPAPKGSLESRIIPAHPFDIFRCLYLPPRLTPVTAGYGAPPAAAIGAVGNGRDHGDAEEEDGSLDLHGCGNMKL